MKKEGWQRVLWRLQWRDARMAVKEWGPLVVALKELSPAAVSCVLARKV